MKTTVPVRKHTVSSVLFPAAAIFILAVSFTAATGKPVSASTGDMLHAGPASSRYYAQDTIMVQKQITSKKYKIKLYPNASHEVLFFSASGYEGKVYQLYLFDMDGILVKQANIRNKQTTVLNNMEKGNYLFEVFSDDERIENGQVLIR